MKLLVYSEYFLFLKYHYICFTKIKKMVVEIKKNISPSELKALLEASSMKKVGLRKFVGKLKRGLDGLAYQKEIRNEWN